MAFNTKIRQILRVALQEELRSLYNSTIWRSIYYRQATYCGDQSIAVPPRISSAVQQQIQRKVDSLPTPQNNEGLKQQIKISPTNTTNHSAGTFAAKSETKQFKLSKPVERRLQPQHLTPYAYDIGSGPQMTFQESEKKVGGEHDACDTLNRDATLIYRKRQQETEKKMKRYNVEHINKTKPNYGHINKIAIAIKRTFDKSLQPSKMMPFGATHESTKSHFASYLTKGFAKSQRSSIAAVINATHRKSYSTFTGCNAKRYSSADSDSRDMESELGTCGICKNKSGLSLLKKSSVVDGFHKSNRDAEADSQDKRLPSLWFAYSEMLNPVTTVLARLSYFPKFGRPHQLQRCSALDSPFMYNVLQEAKHFRHYSTQSKEHKGVLGPEGTVMPKLQRLKKRKHALSEPQKICHEEKVCDETQRSDKNLKIGPKNLPTLPVSDCPCIDNSPMKDVPLRKLKRRHLTEPTRLCPNEEICDPNDRADAGLTVKKKTLPTHIPKPCNCVPQSWKDVPLVRLPKKHVPEPPKVCPKPDACDPSKRADAGLKVEKKALPIHIPKPCECVPQTWKDVSIKRLPRVEVPEPPKICPEQDVCDPSERADAGMKVKKKTLPIHKAKPCECVPQTWKDIPLLRLPKKHIPEPPKICPQEEACDPTKRADNDLKIKPKTLPVHIPKPCECVPQTWRDVSFSRLPKKDIPEPPKICAKTDACDPSERADAGLQLKKKTLPVHIPKPCECVPQKWRDVSFTRLPKKQLPEPPKICPEPDVCDPSQRADAGLKVQKKSLPIHIPKPCECVPHTWTDVHLKRLPRIHVAEPPKICPDADICNPMDRADAGLKVHKKTLPIHIPKPCECVPQTWKDVSLSRLPKKHIPDPPKICPKEDICDPTQRADTGLKINPKTLPVHVPKPCECVPQKWRDVSFSRLPKKDIPEPPKVCPKTDACDPSERADTGLKLKKKILPVHIPKPCECVPQKWRDVSFTRLPKKEIPEPPKICPEPDVCDPSQRADAGLIVQNKTLPIHIPKPCECVPQTWKNVGLTRLPRVDVPEPQKICPAADVCNPMDRADAGLKVQKKILPIHIPKPCACMPQTWKDVALPRLPKKHIPEPRKICPENDICDPTQRADIGLKIKPKTLPVHVPKPCECVPQKWTDVSFSRLPRKEVLEPPKVCPKGNTCDPSERADAGITLKKKTLPVHIPKPCECVPQTWTDVSLKRLPKKEIPEPPKICSEKDVCDPMQRADANLTVKRKDLPPLVLKPCPCVTTEWKDIRLRRLPKMDVREPKKVCLTEDKCEEGERADYQFKLKRKILPTMLLCERNNDVSLRDYNKELERKRKKFSTVCWSGKYCNYKSNNAVSNYICRKHLFANRLRMNVNVNQNLATTSSKWQSSQKSKKSKYPKFGKTTKCTKIKMPGCAPPARTGCEQTMSVPPCTKQNSPYPSFADTCPPDEEDIIMECPKSKDHLQPRNPILSGIAVMQPPPPDVDKVDPEEEEQCIYKKLNQEPCGAVYDCENFDKSVKNLRAKDVIPKTCDLTPPGPDSSAPARDKQCPVVCTNPCEKEAPPKKDDCATKTEPKKICEPKIKEPPKNKCEPRKQETKKREPVKKSVPFKPCQKSAPPKASPKVTPRTRPKIKPQACKVKQDPCANKPKSLWQRICDYFRARPNCPAPDDWKKKKLREKAEKAAKEAGLVLCDPKVLEYQQKKSERVGKSKDPCAKKKPDPCQKHKEVSSKCATIHRPPPKKKYRKHGAGIKNSNGPLKKCEPPPEKCKTETNKCEPLKKENCNPPPKQAEKKLDVCNPPDKKIESTSKSTPPPPKSDKPPAPKKEQKQPEDKCKIPSTSCGSSQCVPTQFTDEKDENCDLVHKTNVLKCKSSNCSQRRHTCPSPDSDESAPLNVDKKKCPSFNVGCPPRARKSCSSGKTKIRKCISPQVEAPYPAFSDCEITFPRLPDSECRKQAKLQKKSKIHYPKSGSGNSDADGSKKCFSTFSSSVMQVRRYSSGSNSKHLQDFLELFDSQNQNVTDSDTTNELRMKVLKAVQEGIRELCKRNRTISTNYCGILQEMARLEGTYLIERSSLIAMVPICYDDERNQNQNDHEDVEENLMNICQTITSYHDNCVLNYEESEQKKTQEMRNILDNLLKKI